MRWISLLLLWLVSIGSQGFAAISPESVAVLYNSAIPESRQLAEYYCKARSIPMENLLALQMPVTQDITRAQYDDLIAEPLRRDFNLRGWWRRQTDSNGVTVPTFNRIKVLVTVRGVPLRIQALPKGAGELTPEQKKDPLAGHDEAAVDSELAMFGVEGVPIEAVLVNRYYQSTESMAKGNYPYLTLTARIDAPSYATCERMIRDAVETEKTGLWGMAYVDIANKFPMGDGWLETVVKENLSHGIPTAVDRFNDTLPSHYPMREAAMYYGWYITHVNGPFSNPNFQFRKGAVAMHLHSSSASQLTNPNQNWSAALLERGAAVTIGNVYEPYLHLTHNFGIMHQRLLEGYTWVEACWMAMPATSWQAIVLGDPLYRPFLHLDGTGDLKETDRAYRVLRSAALKWKSDLGERRIELERAAGRMSSGVLLEALGLEAIEGRRMDAARNYYLKASELYAADADKLRIDMHLIAIDRAAKRNELAIRGLRTAEIRYQAIPEVLAVKGWLDILDPPPPPPADPQKVKLPEKSGSKGL